MRIIHISDIHLPTPIPAFSLRGKMFIGYLSYKYRRKKKYPFYIFESILSKIKSMDYDCLIISGDLTNVSSEEEFENAYELLKPILDERTFIIPGNHDRYVNRAVFPTDLFMKYFDKFTGEDAFPKENIYLKFKKFKKRMIIGWDSNFPNSMIKATGYIDQKILTLTKEFLKKQNSKNPIIVCHHPLWNPHDKHESVFHRLENRDEVISSLNTISPIAYLHGHVHSNWIRLPDEKISFHIFNSGSSTRIPDHSHKSGFHLIDIGEKDLKFSRFIYSKKESTIIQDVPVIYLK